MGDLVERRNTLARFVVDAKEALADVRRLREEVPLTTSKAGRTQIALDMVTPRKLIREQLAGALRRSELTVVPSDNSDTAAPLVEVLDSAYEGTPAKVLAFQSVSVLFSYEKSFNPAHELAKVQPYIDIVSRYDVDALIACLDFAERSFQSDIDLAIAYAAELDTVLQPVQWKAEAVLVNRGDRAMVVHAHAVLTTRGTERKIAGLPMRITSSMLEGTPQAGEANDRFSSDSSAYLSVAPQSTLRLVLEADSDELSPETAALEAVYDQGLLDCSLVMLRQGRTFPSTSTLKAPFVRFGANLSSDQRRRVLEVASPR